jgi:hypothetical protein
VPAHADTVVGGMHQILLDAEVAFRRLDTRVPEQQLDLLQLGVREQRNRELPEAVQFSGQLALP